MSATASVHPLLSPYDDAYANEPGLPADPEKPRLVEYIDVARALAGDLQPPIPTLLRRSDGVGLAYRGRDTVFFGDPETGKSLACAFATRGTLADGGSVAWIDVDHNGAEAILARLLACGVPAAVLADPTRFRLAVPEDAGMLTALVLDIANWAPTLAIIDSIGEVVPMFSRNSNSADDWTAIHQAVIKPLTRRNVATISVDHEAKGSDSRAFGTSGTAAKVRTVDGTMLRFTLLEPFAPGLGGAAKITLRKDRHGGLRKACAPGVREPTVAIFQVEADEHAIRAHLYAPLLEQLEKSGPTDLEQLQALVPPPKSVRDVQKRMTWSTAKAMTVLRLYREAEALLVTPSKGGVTQQQLPSVSEALLNGSNSGEGS